MRKAWPLSQCSTGIFALITLIAAAAFGQDGIAINSSPSPVGSGARALGMGSAFIAVADDATAASWNPSGLTQLERPEISLVYSWKFFNEQFKHTRFIEGSDDTFNIRFQDVNFASIVYPVPLSFGGRNLVLALSYQRKLDFDRKVRLTARQTIAAGGIGTVGSKTKVDFLQEGSLSTLSPAIGFEVSDRLSIGLAVNLWDSDIISSNRWKTRNRNKSFLTVSLLPGMLFVGLGDTAEDFTNYNATNYTLGLLYKPNEHWSVGAVWHTKYEAEYRYKLVQRTFFPTPFHIVSRSRQRIEWPAAFGLGVAYRFSNDKLTLSLDVSYREWDSFIKITKNNHLNRRFAPRRVSAITGLPKRLSPHKPTWTVRLGAEYVFFDPKKPAQKIMPTLRAGLFYDPEPASGARDTFFGVMKGDGDPDDYYGFTFGAGMLLNNRVNIDAAYQLRYGSNVKRDTFIGQSPLENDFHEDVIQHQLVVSTVVYF